MEPQTSSIFFWISWASLIGIIAVIIWKYFPKGTSTPAVKEKPALEKPIRTTKRKSGLQSDILVEGSGPGAKSGDQLTVHYTAFLVSGEEVDSSYQRGKPFSFKLGVGSVILGWDEALIGAQAGESRKVTVPSDLAYGSKGQNKVPPGANVIFEINLLEIKKR